MVFYSFQTTCHPFGVLHHYFPYFYNNIIPSGFLIATQYRWDYSIEKRYMITNAIIQKG